MDESTMLEHAQDVLRANGTEDELLAIGWFYPRGHTAGGIAGGMTGEGFGSTISDLAGSIGVAAGYEAGTHGVDAASGLPAKTFVAASAERIYLMAGVRDGATVPGPVFATLDRATTEVKVHGRVNVRVLELIAPDATYELEGSRIPTTHAKDVIHLLAD